MSNDTWEGLARARGDEIKHLLDIVKGLVGASAKPTEVHLGVLEPSIKVLESALTEAKKSRYSHPGAYVQLEGCSHCSQLMEPKLYETKDFRGWRWFCQTCQK